MSPFSILESDRSITTKAEGPKEGGGKGKNKGPLPVRAEGLTPFNSSKKVNLLRILIILLFLYNKKAKGRNQGYF